MLFKINNNNKILKNRKIINHKHKYKRHKKQIIIFNKKK